MSWCVYLTNCGRPRPRTILVDENEEETGSSRTILTDENEEETESSRTILTDENEEETESCCSRCLNWPHSKWGLLTMMLLCIIRAVVYSMQNSMRQEREREQEELTVSKIISRSDKNKYLNIFILDHNN